jgi:cation-transporting ATPase 13A1
VLFGGTKVVQHSADKDARLRAPNNGCIVSVLRTGFETSQGRWALAAVRRLMPSFSRRRLMRTILFTSNRVTANNLESAAFIGFLLSFAIAASSYVLYHGWQNPDRSKYKVSEADDCGSLHRSYCSTAS